MLVEAVKGKSVAEAEEFLQQVLAMFRGDVEPDESRFGELAYLAGVRFIPPAYQVRHLSMAHPRRSAPAHQRADALKKLRPQADNSGQRNPAPR
ncbi:MAG: hypothetical protein KatS3mg021_1375 [Fimbriimonadales bacterium]|nr:MAG: hypothetical protein KatS3mg021_1375 [Fimbriimonadales bacterium]